MLFGSRSLKCTALNYPQLVSESFSAVYLSKKSWKLHVRFVRKIWRAIYELTFHFVFSNMWTKHKRPTGCSCFCNWRGNICWLSQGPVVWILISAYLKMNECFREVRRGVTFSCCGKLLLFLSAGVWTTSDNSEPFYTCFYAVIPVLSPFEPIFVFLLGLQSAASLVLQGKV